MGIRQPNHADQLRPAAMFFIEQICGGSRKGRSRESFTHRFTPEEAADKLCPRPACHTWCEHLAEGALTKLYLDRDEVLLHLTDPNVPPSKDDLERHEAEVVAHMDALVARLQLPDRNPLTYVIATRHGYSTKHKAHKLSSRPFVQGMYLRYHDIPRVIRQVKQVRT